jgi:hypothetical protein
VDLALEGIEAESLGDLDELELLFLRELAREAEGGEVVEQDLIMNFGAGKGPLLSGFGGEG